MSFKIFQILLFSFTSRPIIYFIHMWRVGREKVLALTIGIGICIFLCSKKSEISFVLK